MRNTGRPDDAPMTNGVRPKGREATCGIFATAAALLTYLPAFAAMELPPLMVDVLANGEQCRVEEQQMSCDTVGKYLRDIRAPSDHSVAVMLTDMTDQAEIAGQQVKHVIEAAGYSQIMPGFGLYNAFASPALPVPPGSGFPIPHGNSTFYQVTPKASLLASVDPQADHRQLDSIARQIAATYGGHVIYEGGRYFNMTVPERQVAQLKRDARVASVNASGAYKAAPECLTPGCPEVLALTLDDKGQRIKARVGETIELTVGTIGPYGYGEPQISSDAIRFIRDKPLGLPTPAGPIDLYTFEAVAEGQALIILPHHNVNGGPADFSVTILVRRR